jgi:hypothetical protein
MVSSLEKTFNPEYLPILSEFGFNLGHDYDFRGSFEELVEPLLSGHLIVQDGDGFVITGEGRDVVNRLIRNTRFTRVSP